MKYYKCFDHGFTAYLNFQLFIDFIQKSVFYNLFVIANRTFSDNLKNCFKNEGGDRFLVIFF